MIIFKKGVFKVHIYYYSVQYEEANLSREI